MIVRLKAMETKELKFYNFSSFNSMIVRLKVVIDILRNVMLMFQFYDSPIKSVSNVLILQNDISFNSMIVRLKA